ncbi:MAG: hypothetical protein V3T23_00260 [Nitrososphaerales archaeon]
MRFRQRRQRVRRWLQRYWVVLKRKQLGELIRGLIDVRVSRDGGVRGAQFRVMVGIDDMMVTQVFAPGDQQVVRYLARQLSYEVEKEMLSLNFRRISEEHGDGVWQRIGDYNPIMPIR